MDKTAPSHSPFDLLLTPPQPAAFALSCLSTLLLFGLLVRLRLLVGFARSSAPTAIFSLQSQGVLSFFSALWSDLLLATWCATCAWLWLWVLHALPSRHRLREIAWWLSLLGLHLLLLLYALAAGAHHRVLLEMDSGLTYAVLREARSALTFEAFWTLLHLTDALYLLAPWLLLWSQLYLPNTAKPWRVRVLFASIALIAALELTQALSHTPPLHPAIRQTALEFLAKDFIETRSHRRTQDAQDAQDAAPQPQTQPQPRPPKRPPARPKPRTSPKSPYPTPKAQHQSLRLYEPLFLTTNDPPPKSLLKPQKKQDWNIVLVVLESLGTRYINDTSQGNRIPMPFLEAFKHKSWFFKRHFSTANSSPRSLFSIFTGLYPIPQFDMFVMRKDVFIPTIAGFLPKKYESFLVTPGGLFWYFPKKFFQNNGPKDLTGGRSRALRRLKRYGDFANEIDTVSYFIKRLQRAQEPFFATYVSFVPHGPYDDYGPKYRILPNLNKNFHRYLNNLNVLDQQLARLFRYLQTSGKLDRTILVMVGDHGEAFWQHRYNFGHSRKSFNENYHAPLYFYQPKLFPPKIWDRLTSHVDILPTLLDALQIPYNPNLLQGESLFQTHFQRKQIFLFGNEQTLTSMRHDGQKMQYTLKRRRCWRYDLRHDPQERKRLSCRGHEQQFAALRRFLQLQRKLILGYNRSRKRHRPFFGQRHPTVSLSP